MPTRQLCTFFVDQLFLGVDVLQVQEVIRVQTMTIVPQASPMVRGLINLRGQIVTAIDLRRRLGFPDQEDWCPVNIIIRTDDGVVSMLVDEIGDVLEVTEDTFEPPPDSVQEMAKDVIAGVYKLPERLLLFLDTTKAISVTDSLRSQPEEVG